MTAARRRRSRRPGLPAPAPLAITNIDIRPAGAPAAGAQAIWIAAMEPWRGLGYSAAVLEKFLRHAASAGQVWIAIAGATGSRAVAQGLIVLQPNVLLGSFVALLAVQPAASGQGIGRALVRRAETETFPTRRWLYVSSDATNSAALAFYRRLGFTRVGRLPNMIRAGRTEVLLRKGRPG